MKLRFDLRRGRECKRFCEEGGCSNLATVEEEYIRKVQRDIEDIQRRRRLAFASARSNETGMNSA